MLFYQPDQNFLPIQHEIPWQFERDVYNSLSYQFCCFVYEKQIQLGELEIAYIQQTKNQHIFERITEARSANKFAPLKKQFILIDSWKQRKQKLEFDNETDYHFGFTVSERYRTYKPIDVPRFEINVISLDFNYHYPLYIPADTILGSVIDCIVKYPVCDYKIYNSKYILSEEILQQRLVELYERDIDFRILIVEKRNSDNKIFGYQFYDIIPSLSHFPKVYDFSTNILNKQLNPSSSNFAIFPPKTTTICTNQTTNSQETKQSNNNKNNKESTKIT